MARTGNEARARKEAAQDGGKHAITAIVESRGRGLELPPGTVLPSVSVTFVWVIISSLIVLYRMFTVLAHLLKASYSILGYRWNILFSSCFGFLEIFGERSRGALIGFSPYLLGLLREM